MPQSMLDQAATGDLMLAVWKLPFACDRIDPTPKG